MYHGSSFKNVKLGLAIFDAYSKVDPQARLISFGEYAAIPDLKLPPNGSHYVNPPQEKIREIYAQCDVWLCPSNSEGFHLPPLEAMACRCPVLSTPVGGPCEIIEDGINGFFFPIGDAASAVARLAQINAMSEADWLVMSDNAFKTASSFTWEAASAKFEEALLDAIDRGSAVTNQPRNKSLLVLERAGTLSSSTAFYADESGRDQALHG